MGHSLTGASDSQICTASGVKNAKISGSVFGFVTVTLLLLRLHDHGRRKNSGRASKGRPRTARATILISRRYQPLQTVGLRRQPVLYVERRVKPRRLDAATRVSLALLSRPHGGKRRLSRCCD